MAGNREFLIAQYEQLATGGDLSEWVEALADDVVMRIHGPAPQAGERKGKAAVLEVMGEVAPTRQGERLVAESFVGDGDEIVVLGSESWTYVPTGKSTTARFAHHYRFSGGKITMFEDFEIAGRDVY